MSRPPVSVVVPFAGDAAAARSMLDALGQLRTAAGDEVVVVDNSPVPSVAVAEEGPVRIVRAIAERSSYHARNAGAIATSGEWLLFTDGDCVPLPDLLDEYFVSAPNGGSGALAGEVIGDPSQRPLAARWARARARLSQSRSLEHPFRPYASTANLLVRRTAFEAVGGFTEGIRSGGDADFCWRLADAGWSIELRERAFVWHRHPETVSAMLRQAFRYGGSQAWLERRYPDSLPGGSASRYLGETTRKAATCVLRGEWEEARFCALDVASFLAEAAGRRSANRPPAD